MVSDDPPFTIFFNQKPVEFYTYRAVAFGCVNLVPTTACKENLYSADQRVSKSAAAAGFSVVELS